MISGVGSDIEAVLKGFETEGIVFTPLTVSHAFHSPLMEPMLSAFESECEKVSYSPPQIGLISNVTGALAGEDRLCHAEYWRRHVREPVQFTRSMATLWEQGVSLFVEIGPHPVLLGMGQRCVPEQKGQWLPSLRRGWSDWRQMMESLATLYVEGVSVDWPGFDRDYPRSRVALPNYAFQRERYWIKDADPILAEYNEGSMKGYLMKSSHSMLGQRISGPLITYETQLSCNKLDFLGQHRVLDTPVLPTSVFLEMVIGAAEEAFEAETVRIKDLVIREPLFLHASIPRKVQLIVIKEDSRSASFKFFSLVDEDEGEQQEWRLQATGRIDFVEVGLSASRRKDEESPLRAIQTRCNEASVEEFYEKLNAEGLRLKKNSQAIDRLWRGQGEVLAIIRIKDNWKQSGKNEYLRPALLDSCLQLMDTVLDDHGIDENYILNQVSCFTLHCQPGPKIWCHARLKDRFNSSAHAIIADIDLFDEQGYRVASFEGVHLVRLTPEHMRHFKTAQFTDWLYEIQWSLKRQEAEDVSDDADITDLSEFVHLKNAKIVDLYHEHGLGLYDDFLPELDALSVSYILKAMSELGWNCLPQQCFTTVGLAQKLGVLEKYYLLFGRLLEILSEDGILKKVDQGWEVIQIPMILNPQAQWEKLVSVYQEGTAELTLIGRCGMQLASVLKGECDPLDLLFPGGDLSDAENLYELSPFARAYNSLIRDVVKGVIDSLQSHRMIRCWKLVPVPAGQPLHFTGTSRGTHRVCIHRCFAVIYQQGQGEV